MIFPFPLNIYDFKKYPVTWTLVFLNVFWTLTLNFNRPREINYAILDSKDIQYVGRIYEQSLPKLSSYIVKKNIYNNLLFDLENVTKENKYEILGRIAITDQKFVKYVSHEFFKESFSSESQVNGDQVWIGNIKNVFKQMNLYIQNSPYQTFGLSPDKNRILTWITYQFTQTGFIHLLSNMVFLVVLGVSLEATLGGMGLIMIYIIGGLVGGIFYSVFNQMSSVPMIGASASLSALLSFYLFYETRKNIRFFYFFSPFEGYFGFAYFPKFIIFPLWMLSDYTQFLMSHPLLSNSVAYSAHIGGSLGGLILVIFEVFFIQNSITRSKSTSHRIFGDTNWLNKLF